MLKKLFLATTGAMMLYSPISVLAADVEAGKALIESLGPQVAGGVRLGGNLGISASATDHYRVNCSTNGGGESALLQVRIKDLTETIGGGKLSAVIYRENVAATVSDHVRVDRGEGCVGWNDVQQDVEFGPFAEVSMGNGVYYILVHKQKEGPKNYLLEFHCKTDIGVHTSTSVAVATIQDQ